MHAMGIYKEDKQHVNAVTTRMDLTMHVYDVV